MRIGQVASLAGVPSGTLRYYERRGLLPKPARTPSGYRSYPPQAVTQLKLIRWAQDVGFTLREIRETFQLVGDHVGGEGDKVRARVDAKLREIDARIAGLESIRATLAALGGCRCQGDCPIIRQALNEPAARPRKRRG
jgi:DNA-binding transcriptional MerR regulator